MQARPMPSCSVCVCLSVMFVHSVKTNKHIFKIFSPPDSYTILEFPYQTAWQYSNGNPPNGTSNAGGVGDNLNSQRISGFAIGNCCTMVCVSHFEARFLFTTALEDETPCTISSHGSLWLCSVRDWPNVVSRYAQSRSTVNRVYDSEALHYAEDNWTESNCTHW